MKVSEFGNIRSLKFLINPEDQDEDDFWKHAIFYFYNDMDLENQFYWKDNETFVFKPDLDEEEKRSHKDVFEDAGLSMEINEFKVR